VPDFYQGAELWDLSLVDPDNRRPVDYSLRSQILKDMEKWPASGARLTSRVRDLTSKMCDGRIKMYLTWKALNLRKQQPLLFLEGEYIPLGIDGPSADHLLAFARRLKENEIIVVVPRLCAKLLGDGALPPGQDLWKDTRLRLMPQDRKRNYRNLFTADINETANFGDELFFDVAVLLANFPVAVLVAEPIG
jgi:(1->4)-alpha-D-glucan 1-alpha-D-glucosylmutase